MTSKKKAEQTVLEIKLLFHVMNMKTAMVPANIFMMFWTGSHRMKNLLHRSEYTAQSSNDNSENEDQDDTDVQSFSDESGEMRYQTAVMHR